jgi:hypothetical protein
MTNMQTTKYAPHQKQTVLVVEPSAVALHPRRQPTANAAQGPSWTVPDSLVLGLPAVLLATLPSAADPPPLTRRHRDENRMAVV